MAVIFTMFATLFIIGLLLGLMLSSIVNKFYVTKEIKELRKIIASLEAEKKLLRQENISLYDTIRRNGLYNELNK